MRYNGLIRVVTEQRHYSRVPYHKSVHYRHGVAIGGSAVCTDVGLGGLNLRVGRYLRPGTLLMVTFNESTSDGAPLQLKGRIAWCRGADGYHFAAGLRVFHDEPESVTALTRLAAKAASNAGAGHARLTATAFPKVVMG